MSFPVCLRRRSVVEEMYNRLNPNQSDSTVSILKANIIFGADKTVFHTPFLPVGSSYNHVFLQGISKQMHVNVLTS